MSRFDPNMTAAGEAAELQELLVTLGGGPPPGSARYWAMAQYLSGADGWRDAGAALGGAFGGYPKNAAEHAGLTGGVEE